MTKRRNIDNLLVDLQKLLSKYNAELLGLNDIGIRINYENGIQQESMIVRDITPKSIVKNIYDKTQKANK